MSSSEILTVDKEICKLLRKKVIVETSRCEGDFVSPVFTRPKKDGNRRMILNLKQLNSFVVYQHFKMEGLDNVLNLMKPNVWMASVDLKDAFFSIPVHPEYQKYFKFYWKGIYYQFQGMPNGYGPAMRLFNKQLKPPFIALRKQGYPSLIFVDDSYLQGNTKTECEDNVWVTIHLLRKLGFTINDEKSVFCPTQVIEFLGFIISSLDMTVRLNEKKIADIKKKVIEFFNSKNVTIRDLASLIGTLVSTFSAIAFGRLYYRKLEMLKINALKAASNDVNATIVLNDCALKELNWWLYNLDFKREIETPPVDCIIHTDANKLGLGADNDLTPTGSHWTNEEDTHVNILKLLAIYMAARSYCKSNAYKHVRIMSDNTTAISYVNNMGGIKSISCNQIAFDIWQYCISKNMWISAAFIPGKKNKTADYKSRNFKDNTEWQLKSTIFSQVVEILSCNPDIDLFASYLNCQMDKYVSWQPDPYSFAVDAFSISWSEYTNVYAFPPFSLVGPVLTKLRQDKVTGIIVIPYWTTQYWFPMMLEMLTEHPLLLPNQKDTIQLPFRKDVIHPLYPK